MATIKNITIENHFELLGGANIKSFKKWTKNTIIFLAGAITLFLVTEIPDTPSTAEAEMKNELTEILHKEPEATFIFQISKDQTIELKSTDYEIHLKDGVYNIFIDGVQYQLVDEHVFIEIK